MFVSIDILKGSTLACLIAAQCLINAQGWICLKIIKAQDLISAQAINKANMTYKVKKRTGWEIFLKLINAQVLISSHRTDFYLKKINARATIRQARVLVTNT